MSELDDLQQYINRTNDEFIRRNYPDIAKSRDDDNALEMMFRKEDELRKVMDSVASKFLRWSLARDHFISELTEFQEDLRSKLNTDELSVNEAIRCLDMEIASLRKQDEAMGQKNVRQVIVVRPGVISTKSAKENYVDLLVAGVGFISGALEFVGGVALVSSGVGSGVGALMLAHGVNNLAESGYFLLYRKNYTGPVKFVYEGVGEVFGLSKSDSDVIYSLTDIGMSLNSLFGYKLEEDATRLYRYINADLLSGLKTQGFKLMSKNEQLVEVLGNTNTLVGQYRSY